MSGTREELRVAATDLGWERLDRTAATVDVYRCAPHSILVDFRRGADDAIHEARLFRDAPDGRQQLPPRLLAEATAMDSNKRRRVRSWLYDYRAARLTTA